MVQAMRRVIDACGVNVINDRSRFRSCLTDFLLDKAARTALLIAQDANVCADFLGVHRSTDAEHNRIIGVAHERLTEDYGLSAERSILILEVYAEGLGWKNYVLPAAPSTAPSVAPSAAPVAQPAGITQTDLEEAVRKALATISQQKTGQPSATAPVQPKPAPPAPASQTPPAPQKPAAPAGPAVGSDIHFGPYDWRVIAVQNNRALLLSKNIIEARPYNEKYTEVTWETCTLRKYLNSVFYNTFSPAERSRIALSILQNPDNNWGREQGKPYGTKGGNPTRDFIFLLSLQDLDDYFGGFKLKKNKDGDESWLDYDDNKGLTAPEALGRFYFWWLRSPGINSCRAMEVYTITNDGSVFVAGGTVDEDVGICPALWLNL